MLITTFGGAVMAVGGTLMNVGAGVPGTFIVRDLIANPAAKYFTEKKGAPSQGKTRGDLSEASAYNKQFDHKKTNTPKIHIWGNEEHPVTWNMISTAAKLPDLKKYISVYADVCNVMQYVSGWYFTPVGYSFGEAYEFFKLDGRANAQWQDDILHASHTERKSYTYWQWSYVKNCYTEAQTQMSRRCNRWGWFGWLCKAFTTIINVITCFWSSVATLFTGYYDQLVIDRSDGTVTEWSAQGKYRPNLYNQSTQQAWSQGATIIRTDTSLYCPTKRSR